MNVKGGFVMQIKKIFNASLIITIIFSFLTICSAMGYPSMAFAEIGANSYCQLHIQVMEQTVSNLNKSITKPELEQNLEQLYDSYDTTEREYIFYMGKSSARVNAYLKSHPDMKQRIDALAEQISSLLEKYDTQK